MKRYFFFLLSSLFIGRAAAQVGAPYIHDPSTIAECEGKYYTLALAVGVSSQRTDGAGTAVLSAREAELHLT